MKKMMTMIPDNFCKNNGNNNDDSNNNNNNNNNKSNNDCDIMMINLCY